MLINILFPVFAVIATGYLLGRFKVLSAASGEALNAFVYWVALPALLFGAMARVDLVEIYNVSFIAAFAGASFATWIIFTFIGRIVFKLDHAEAALHGLNGAYANTGYMGIALAITAFGQEAALPAIIATVISVLSVILAVIPVEIARHKTTNYFTILRRLAIAVLKNPMIIAPCAGLLWSASGFEIAISLTKYLDLLAAAAGPCALFSIGLSLVRGRISENMAELISMTFGKLVINPLLTAIAVIVIFPTDPLWTKVAILLAALPVGSGPFVLANAYGLYSRQTAAVMVLTTILSLATLSLIILYLPMR